MTPVRNGNLIFEGRNNQSNKLILLSVFVDFELFWTAMIRKDELEILNRFFREDKFQFIPIYERRRIAETPTLRVLSCGSSLNRLQILPMGSVYAALIRSYCAKPIIMTNRNACLDTIFLFILDEIDLIH